LSYTQSQKKNSASESDSLHEQNTEESSHVIWQTQNNHHLIQQIWCSSFCWLKWLKNRLKTVLTDNWKFNVHSNSYSIRHCLHTRSTKSIFQWFSQASWTCAQETTAIHEINYWSWYNISCQWESSNDQILWFQLCIRQTKLKINFEACLHVKKWISVINKSEAEVCHYFYYWDEIHDHVNVHKDWNLTCADVERYEYK